MKSLIKVFAVLIVLGSFSEVKAQISGGLGLVYATNISNIGININGKYDFDETWSAAPTFTYFFKKDNITWTVLDLDANYKITDLDKIGSLYALAGLNMTFYSWKYEYGGYSDSDTGLDVGINLGAGLNIPVNEKINIAPEVRYTLGGANYFRIGAKVMYSITSKE
ncbi:MAG: hypothetical protein B6D64_03025 [Bacteroidetes bacterium 4484_276]|nr:MAG: hypothetical protein B6D64_03025 [Bacteroidetes bacterium 4484_276]